MPNIALLNYCNLQCPYCFANEYIEEQKQTITMQQLERILGFCSTSQVSRIGLIGGEPTLHPEIEHIINRVESYCADRKIRWILFTNGIELYRIIHLMCNSHGSCLVNINHPSVLGTAKWMKLLKSLRLAQNLHCMNQIQFGINLYPNMIDFTYIIDLALQFNKKKLRVSYVAPTCDYRGVDKDLYYQDAKHTFLNFVKVAKQHDIRLEIDCNHVPYCYFDDDEKILMQSVVSNWHNYCNPVVDISPDFKGSSCFGAYDLVDLSDFDTLEEAERYFLVKKMLPLAYQNNAGKCNTCEKFNKAICQGGCLAFAKYNNVRI